ncbi:MAG TPA: hypothetical protein IAD07_02865 [Candidatus Fimivicinus intestinavium]|nr:hypothetical protein [Candidatus Fimivicinus intestinavium]
MGWVESIGASDTAYRRKPPWGTDIQSIARQTALPSFYFQKGFVMLCGMTVGEYIRQRQLSQAGIEVITTGQRIIRVPFYRRLWLAFHTAAVWKMTYSCHVFVVK